MAAKRKQQKRPPKTPDPRTQPVYHDELSESSKLHMKPCKFWKFGKCNWGWGCRFLHGTTLGDDPRRPEYRGSPVDFTQFPRPASSSPQYYHDDQSRAKPLRNPVVEIAISNDSLRKYAVTMKELLLRNSIDVYQAAAAPILTHETATSAFEEHGTDFMIFIDSNVIILFPDSVSVPQQTVVEWIRRHWNSMNKNLSAEEIELMTTNDFETRIKQLTGPSTGIDDITSTINGFQDSVSCAIASQEFEACKIKQQDLTKLRLDIANFFGKLNLANSIIADFPLYGTSQQPHPGSIVSTTPEKPNGISLPLQKALTFMIGQFLTQIHVCLSYVNKMLGETALQGTNRITGAANPAATGFTVATGTAQGLHPSPYCFVDCANLLSTIDETSSRPTVDYSNNGGGRRMGLIEPEFSVEVRSPYTLSFREGIDTNANFQKPFDQ